MSTDTSENDPRIASTPIRPPAVVHPDALGVTKKMPPDDGIDLIPA